MLKKSKVKYSVIKKSRGGKVSCKVLKGSRKYISASKKGVVTVKKNAEKGRYKLKITVSGKGGYKKTTKVITLRII